jgi:hypothetical protein
MSFKNYLKENLLEGTEEVANLYVKRISKNSEVSKKGNKIIILNPKIVDKTKGKATELHLIDNGDYFTAVVKYDGYGSETIARKMKTLPDLIQSLK